ncbi:MAG: type II toxin-antitoxin system HicA family toxin [Acidobacteria bacterium]|nr:type II toxin-antitoxin system HicA family toxin [Acidobacteriota bacterium]
MPKLRVLSGRDVVRIFSHFAFTTISQRGSHVKLQRILTDGTRQTLTIPTHYELDRGTLKAIYRQAQRYVAEGELRPHFCGE